MVERWRIGVCSWSLEPTDATVLVERACATGVAAVQLALDPVRLGVMSVSEIRRRMREGGLELVSGMMAMEGEDYSSLPSIEATGGVTPDRTWGANRAAARELARIGRELGIPLVTFHAGFLPERDDPRSEIIVNRLRELASCYLERGMRVALETGQERPTTLRRVLGELEREGAGSNFDPGNIILYGQGDPLPALKQLAPRVLQVHIKDARPSETPGVWGTEVPVGHGAVEWPTLLLALRECPELRSLVIERESGNDRVGDVTRAREFLQAALR
jgi:sugar phosphate isomerase/epimerase